MSLPTAIRQSSLTDPCLPKVTEKSRESRTIDTPDQSDWRDDSRSLTESTTNGGLGSFSRDGRYLLFGEYHPDSLGDIGVLALEGERKVTTLANGRFNERAPLFSPMAAGLPVRYEIYVQPFPGGGGKSQISTKGGHSPRWSKDGLRLFYESDSAVMSVVIRKEGNELKARIPQAIIETDDESSSSFCHWDVAADGKRFVLIRDEDSVGPASPALLKFTVNWFEELKQLVPRK